MLSRIMALCFPLYRGWFEERDIDLPLPCGVGGAVVYMEREIEIEVVEVSIGERPPVTRFLSNWMSRQMSTAPAGEQV